MTKKDLKFSVSQLIINSVVFNISTFLNIKTTDLKKDSIIKSETDKTVLSIEKIVKKDLENRFISIYFEEGDRFPYAKKVVNSKDALNLEEIDNPRSPDQIELDKQFFVLIDSKTQRIFMSDRRKKSAFASWLGDKLKKDIIIKPLIEEKDFVDKIESINKIFFTVKPNLLNAYNAGTLSTELSKDIFGFDADYATVELVYKNRLINDKIKNKIRSIFNKKTDFKNITIIGRDSEKFESIFNTDEIINKLSITTMVGDDGKFNPDQIFNLLLLKIKEDEK